MKIVIIGAGFTGSLLAKALIAERNKVILIDKSPERVRSAGDQLDCTVIEADGTDLDILEKAGIASADALVTLTGDDEINMITCSLTDAIYPNVLKIARVRNYDYYTRTVDIVRRGKDRLSEDGRPVFGIDHIINPDVAAASSISRAMEIGAAGSATEIEGGYEIIVLPVAEESPLSGKKLRELAAIPEWKYLVAFVESDGETELPCGDTVLNPGDHVGILVHNSEVPKLLRFAGVISTPINRVAIFGADNIGALTVAAQEDRKKAFWRAFLKLGKTKSRELLVIDRDAELCRKLADKFPDARILNGDITDDGFLLSEGVCDCDLMVAASGNYERNLLTAAYLKLRGVTKAIALTLDSAFSGIAAKIGVDVTVPMRDVVIDTIMSHLRGRNIKAVHSVGARKFEIVSCEVSSRGEVSGKKLRELEELKGSLVLLIRQPEGSSYEIPNGGTELRKGALVVLIMPSGDSEILEMFAGKPEMTA